MIAAEEIFSKLSAEGQSKAVATNGCVLQDVDTPEPIQVGLHGDSNLGSC